MTVALTAESGPALATVMVYVSSCPACTGSGEADFVTEKFAEGGVGTNS